MVVGYLKKNVSIIWTDKGKILKYTAFCGKPIMKHILKMQ